MYRIAYAQSARKALKRLMKSGSFPKAKFKELLGLLMNGKPLPASSKDHKLQGKLLESRECHLGFDLLVIYKRNEIERIVLIEEIGTHPELFGE